MAVTSMGVKYANKIRDTIAAEIEATGSVPDHFDWRPLVHPRRQQDAYDSYVELNYAPPIDPPSID